MLVDNQLDRQTRRKRPRRGARRMCFVQLWLSQMTGSLDGQYHCTANKAPHKGLLEHRPPPLLAEAFIVMLVEPTFQTSLLTFDMKGTHKSEAEDMSCTWLQLYDSRELCELPLHQSHTTRFLVAKGLLEEDLTVQRDVWQATPKVYRFAIRCFVPWAAEWASPCPMRWTP